MDTIAYYRTMTAAQFVAELQDLGPAWNWADYVEAEVQSRDSIARRLAAASLAVTRADGAYGDPTADPLESEEWMRPELRDIHRHLGYAYRTRLTEIAAGEPMVP